MSYFIDPTSGKRVEIVADSVPWGRRHPGWASLVALLLGVVVARLVTGSGPAWFVVFLVVTAVVRVGLRYWPS